MKKSALSSILSLKAGCPSCTFDQLSGAKFSWNVKDFDIYTRKSYNNLYWRDWMLSGNTWSYNLTTYCIRNVCDHQKHNHCISRLKLWVRTLFDTTLCDIICQWLATGLCFFFLDTPVSSTNKTERHDIAEILLKVALNIIRNRQLKRKCCTTPTVKRTTNTQNCSQSTAQKPKDWETWLPTKNGDEFRCTWMVLIKR